jgi:hypothetical protein
MDIKKLILLIGNFLILTFTIIWAILEEGFEPKVGIAGSILSILTFFLTNDNSFSVKKTEIKQNNQNIGDVAGRDINKFVIEDYDKTIVHFDKSFIEETIILTNKEKYNFKGLTFTLAEYLKENNGLFSFHYDSSRGLDYFLYNYIFEFIKNKKEYNNFLNQEEYEQKNTQNEANQVAKKIINDINALNLVIKQPSKGLYNNDDYILEYTNLGKVIIRELKLNKITPSN